MSCQYNNCKYKSKFGNYCGKHFKIIDKLNNPDKYCSKKGCKRPKKSGYKQCEKCIENGKKSDAKRRNVKIKGKCRNCGKDIKNNFATRSGKEPTLCKHHYELQCKVEDNRPERDRKEQYKNYDKNRKNLKHRKEYNYKYYRSVKYKLIDYKAKSNKHEKRKWELEDEYAYHLFMSSCHYCGKKSEELNINGIDRINNSVPYIVGNCVSCCGMCNMMKKDYTYENFINKCKKIYNNFCQDNNKNKNIKSKITENNQLICKLYNYSCKNNISQKRNWDLNENYAYYLFKSPCHYCAEKPPDEDLNGIDRVNNNIHYIIGNCVSCCTVCNMMKKDYEYSAFINKCKQIALYK